MSGRTHDTTRGPKPDVPGFLVFLVVAAIVGACLVAGVRFVARWLEAGPGTPPGA